MQADTNGPIFPISLFLSVSSSLGHYSSALNHPRASYQITSDHPYCLEPVETCLAFPPTLLVPSHEKHSKSLAHAFPQLFLPPDWPWCFPIGTRMVWHGPLLLGTMNNKLIFQGNCLGVCHLTRSDGTKSCFKTLIHI